MAVSEAGTRSGAIELQLPVLGMTCASCSDRISRELTRLPGVRTAIVNLATQQATVAFEGAGVTTRALAQAVEGLGYGVPKQSLELSIGGMTCANCVGRIERRLLALPGVISALVSLVMSTARVEVIAGTVSVSEVAAAVSDLGYSATAVAGQRDADPLTDARDREARRWRRLFLLAAVPALPLLLAMVGHLVLQPHPRWLHLLMYGWVQLPLATVVQFGAGHVFYLDAYRNLKSRNLNMSVLVALGTSAAYFYSLALLLSGFDYGINGLYFETSALLIAIVLLGKYLEARAKGRTSEAIQHLLQLRPRRARVFREGRELEVPVDQVQVGDQVEVRPGERVPVDGEVLEGHSAIDESMMTGESLPVDKAPADGVLAGSVNLQGYLRFRATRVGRDTMLGQIVRLVEEAQSSKAPIQRVVDVVSGYFVPFVVACALISFTGWFLASGDLTVALLSMTAVLVIACPCALGLATPTAIVVGIGRGAQRGILFRGGEQLETAGRIQIVAFDKTGTLTRGEPELTDLVVLDAGLDGDTLLSLAAAAEQHSEHPLGRAVVRAARDRRLPLDVASDFRSLPGLGVEAQVAARRVRVVRASGDVLGQQAIDLEAQGKTVMLVEADGNPAGLLATTDSVKPHARETVAALTSLGIEVWMLTGDNPATAAAVARQASIPAANVLARLLPQAKVESIHRLQASGKRVAMVGDGVNDAPALAAADLGVAVASGADVAIEAAGITLVRDDLRTVVAAIELSRAVLRKVRQNLFWALGYNVVGIPVAGLGYLSPLVAGTAMALSSVSVTTNSTLLRRFEPMRRFRRTGADEDVHPAAMAPTGAPAST